MIVLQFVLSFIHMCLIPYLIGRVVLRGGVSADYKPGIALTTAAGLMASYALYEVLIVILRLAGKGFRLLTGCYAVLTALVAILGVVLWIRRKEKVSDMLREIKKPDRYMILAFVLIAVQIVAILFWATPDEDDAFYSGLSAMSLSYDYLLEYNAYNGMMDKAISARYMLSGLPIYQASLSLLSGRLHHLIIVHNLFPLFYMPLAYGIYYEIAKGFLKKEKVEGANGKFLFIFALLHLIGNYFIYSPENFLVTRIWQGKALFVALGVPCLWYFGEKAMREICKEKGQSLRAKAENCLLLTASLLAVTFMGETGLFLGTFMFACLTLTSCVVYKNLRAILWAAVCWLPTGLLFVYLFLG